MNLKRLQELEKLAGLRVDPTERAKLLEDLNALEQLGSQLPDLAVIPENSDPGKPSS